MSLRVDSWTGVLAQRTTLSPVDVIATEEATELIRERGGRLYVWIQRPRCCGSVAYLGTATEPARGREFRSVDVDGFVLAIDARMSRLPDELHVDVRGWRRRRPVAFWDAAPGWSSPVEASRSHNSDGRERG